MSARSVTREQPLVAVVGTVPLVCEALDAVLDEIAEVRFFPAERGATDGLLRELVPDAVVVDNAEDAAAAEAFAREWNAPLVHLMLREQRMRVLGETGWEEREDGEVSPEAIRNVLVGGLFGRQAA